MCVKKFIFSKFAGLQNYSRGNFTIKWTTSQVFFNSISSTLHAPPCIDISHPPLPHQLLKAPLPNGGQSPPCSQHLCETLIFKMSSHKKCFIGWTCWTSVGKIAIKNLPRERINNTHKLGNSLKTFMFNLSYWLSLFM